jgi:hypothetical protein
MTSSRRRDLGLLVEQRPQLLDHLDLRTSRRATRLGGAGWRWTRAATFRRIEIPDVGVVETWCEVIDVAGPRVTFRWKYIFEADGAVLTSDSTFRFRSVDEAEDSMAATGMRSTRCGTRRIVPAGNSSS